MLVSRPSASVHGVRSRGVSIANRALDQLGDTFIAIGRLATIAGSRLVRYNDSVRRANELTQAPLEQRPASVVPKSFQQHWSPDGQLPGGLNRGIVVTTFEDRQFDRCLPLIGQIRSSGCAYPIMVVMNGNLRGDHDRSQRARFITELASFVNIEVVSLPVMYGISHNWNLGIRLLDAETTLVLSDDVRVQPETFMKKIETAFRISSTRGFCLINGTFATFCMSDLARRKIGLFDERFVGFGEEDGDYVWRYENFFRQPIPSTRVSAIKHLSDETRGDYVSGRTRYSLANEVFLNQKYAFGSGQVRGWFTRPALQRLRDVNPDPLFEFHRHSRLLLSTHAPGDIEASFRKLIDFHDETNTTGNAQTAQNEVTSP